jgi:hypothetical protein
LRVHADDRVSRRASEQGRCRDLRNPRLLAAFGIGFCILFAFIGTFTYVNYLLVRPPFMVGPMELGLPESPFRCCSFPAFLQ